MDDLRASITDRRLLDRATQISRPDNGSWHYLERACDHVWGHFHGTEAYRVALDLSGPRYRCTCPTPTQPCKHALALHLIAVGQPASLAPGQPPPWVPDAFRGQDGPPPKTRSGSAPSDARKARRYEEIDNGARELDGWLTDQIRTGIADLPARSGDLEVLCRRLHDAKAKRLASDVASLLESPPTPGWQGRTLERLGRLYLLLEAWRRRDALDDDLVADLATLLGVSQRKEDALAQPPVDDVWDVLGSKVEYSDEQHLVTMRTWLRGRQSDRYALILQQEFAHDRPSTLPTSFDKTLLDNNAYEADLCFYPSAWPLRSEVRSRGRRVEGISPAVLRTLAATQARFVDALGRQPWLWGIPVFVGGLRVERREDGFWVTDDDGSEAKLAATDLWGWGLLALSGGSQRFAVLGEWDGHTLHLIRAHSESTS